MKSTKKNNIELVPFDAMPKNLPELLTKSDYINVIINPNGFFHGIFEAIHVNPNYPQWQNIMISENCSNNNNSNDDNSSDDNSNNNNSDHVDSGGDDSNDLDMMVYTIDGWQHEKFKNILKICNMEYVTCFAYIYQNKTTVLGIKDSSGDSINIKIPEGMRIHDCIKFPEGIKLPEGVRIPECMKLSKGMILRDDMKIWAKTTDSNKEKTYENQSTQSPTKLSTLSPIKLSAPSPIKLSAPSTIKLSAPSPIKLSKKKIRK